MRTNRKFFKRSKFLPIDKFFSNVLYDKKSGYYSSKIPFGREGDYITAPNISKLYSEIIAILSSGISFYRFLFPFVISACVVTVIAFFSSMFFVPNASKNYNDFEYKFINKSKKIRKTENIYKQISDDDFIYVSNYNSNRNIGYIFAWESFDGNKLKYKINAQNIRWIEKDTIHRLTNFFERINY